MAQQSTWEKKELEFGRVYGFLTKFDGTPKEVTFSEIQGNFGFSRDTVRSRVRQWSGLFLFPGSKENTYRVQGLKKCPKNIFIASYHPKSKHIKLEAIFASHRDIPLATPPEEEEPQSLREGVLPFPPPAQYEVQVMPEVIVQKGKKTPEVTVHDETSSEKTPGNLVQFWIPITLRVEEDVRKWLIRPGSQEDMQLSS